MIFKRITQILRYKVADHIKPSSTDTQYHFNFKQNVGEDQSDATSNSRPGQSKTASNKEEILELTIENEYYANLEIPMGSDFLSIKQSYRTLIKRYHPDRFYHDSVKRNLAQEITAKLNTAYQYFVEKENNADR